MADPELIAEAFVNKEPYYDGEFIVVHNISGYYTTSVIGKVSFSISRDVIIMWPVLSVDQYNDPRAEYRVVVMINPNHANPSQLIGVLNAVFERIKSTIGVEIRAVDAGSAVGVAIKGYKYLFREHHMLKDIVKMRGVRIMGYLKRFAPFSACRECIEVAERIREIQGELKEKSEELYDMWYHHYEVLVRLGIDPDRVRDLAHKGLRMAESDIVVDRVGIYLGSDSPRALLSRYEKTAREVSELLDRIKTTLALEKLLS
jgi:hypothetical protein